MAKEINEEIQYIGADIGRGYSKFWTEIDGQTIKSSIKSCKGLWKPNVDMEYENSVCIEFNGEKLFVGALAEKESIAQINVDNSKISNIAQTLLAAGLSEVAKRNKVILGIGMPNATFKIQKEQDDIVNFYTGKKITVTNLKNNETKEIEIVNVTCYREADAVIYSDEFELEEGAPTGVISVGFRTIERSYYDENFRWIVSSSVSEESGHNRILKQVLADLSNQNSDFSYKISDIENGKTKKMVETKERYYKAYSEGFLSAVCTMWQNASVMSIIVCGGTIQKLDLSYLPSNFIIVDDPIFASAKGLYNIAKDSFEDEER